MTATSVTQSLSCRRPFSSKAVQRAHSLIGAAELLHLVEAHRVAHRDEQSVVRDVVVNEITAGQDLAADPSCKNDRQLAERMIVALADFAAPDDERVVEERAVSLGDR